MSEENRTAAHWAAKLRKLIWKARQDGILFRAPQPTVAQHRGIVLTEENVTTEYVVREVKR